MSGIGSFESLNINNPHIWDKEEKGECPEEIYCDLLGESVDMEQLNDWLNMTFHEYLEHRCCCSDEEALAERNHYRQLREELRIEQARF